MHRRSILPWSGALAVVGALAIAGVMLHHVGHPPSPKPAPVSSPYTATSIRPAPPPASAPLLDREAWLMHWQPAWYRAEWIQAGRPPILWSPQDANYYVKGIGVLLTFPWRWELLPVSALPSWYGYPLKP